MNLKTLADQATNWTKTNNTVVLSAFAVAGVVSSVALAIRATAEATRKVDELRHISNQHYTFRDCVRVNWKLYVPTISVAATTIGCVIATQRIGARRAATLATAYTLSEKAFKEYRSKIVEKIGETKEEKYRDEIVQERMTAAKAPGREVDILADEEVLCYDSISGRYFKSNVQNLRAAQNDLNEQMIGRMYATLSDFYNLIGLAPTDYADNVGWNVDNLMGVRFVTTLSPDERPCLVVDYQVYPRPDFLESLR